MNHKIKSKFYEALGKAKDVRDTDALFKNASVYGKKIAEIAESVKFLIDNFGKLPISQKIYVIASLLYLVDPIDAIPDPTPIIGYLDDIAVLSYVVYQAKNILRRRT